MLRTALSLMIATLLCCSFAPSALAGQGGTTEKAAPGYPTENKAAVAAKLKAKGKTPWMEREKGMGVVTLKSGGTLTEDFFPLDAYEAGCGVDLRDTMPDFAPGYEDQQGKGDDLSRALESHLKKNQPYAFRSLAGEGRVDRVTLQKYGNTAYAFIIPMRTEGFLSLTPNQKHFYYNVPEVLRTLETFQAGKPELDKVIWLGRESGFFMFVLQRKK